MAPEGTATDPVFLYCVILFITDYLCINFSLCKYCLEISFILVSQMQGSPRYFVTKRMSPCPDQPPPSSLCLSLDGPVPSTSLFGLSSLLRCV